MKLTTAILLFFNFYLVYAQSQDPFEINQFMLAESYEQAGNTTKAIEIIEQLFQRNPNNPNYFNKLYNLYLNTKRYETAIRFVELRLATNPDDPSLYGMIGSVYYLMGNFNKARESWETPIKRSPNNPFIYRIMANYAIERRAFDIAIEYLEIGKNKSNDPTIFAIDLGELYLVTMQYEYAIKEYCELLLKNQGMYQVVENKIFSYASKDDFVKIAIGVIGKYESKGALFKNLLARLYTEARELNRAFELYKEVEKLQSTGNQQLLSFGNFLISENEFNTAKNVFEYVYNTSNNTAVKSSAKLGLAKTLEEMIWNDFKRQNDTWKNFYSPKYLTETQTKSLIDAYQEVVNLYRYSDVAVEALYAIGNIYLNINNNLSNAEKAFLEIVNFYPTSRFIRKSLLALAQLQLYKNNIKDAIDYLLAVESTISHSDDEKQNSYLLLAKLKAAEGDFAVAKEFISKITNNVKNDFTNDALEFSLLLNVAKHDSVNMIKYSTAEILIYQKQFIQAQVILDEILKNQQSLVFHPFSAIKSAEIDIATDNYKSALEKLDNIYLEKEKNIFSDKALYLKARIYEYAYMDYNKAIEHYQKILMEFQNSIYVDESRESIIRLNEKIKKREKDA
jgi:tetratricopeptide (TPR) repeat protein